MNLDRFIKMKMIQLDSKYDISLVEIKKVKDGRVSTIINFNYKLKGTSAKENETMQFFNKRELVSWLACLE